MKLRTAALALLGLVSACHPKSKTPGPTSSSGSGSGPAPLTIHFDAAPEVVAQPVGTLRRGINLGNGFDAPREGAWGVVLSETHFEMARAAGLDHVRLPVRFSAHADQTAPYTIDPAFFARIDWAVENALSRGLSIIVDLHHYEELMKDPDAHVERTVGLWKQIAERYRDRPDSVLFELLNEPCNQLTPDKLNALYARLLPVVRATNPTRTLIVDSFFWASPNYLKNLTLPDDPNLVVSFHMYQPILFTHQGASWMDPEFQSTGITFPGPSNQPVRATAAAESTGWTRDWLNNYRTQPASTNPSSPRAVAAEFDTVTRYVAQTGRRAYLGEFGAVDFADATSRENYLRLVRREAERRGFAWSVWDDGGRMQAMNVKLKAWIDPVAKALFTEQPGEPLP
ncbi:MAG TPA: glycoside hydrolase family 5 protein [Polyangiaceae bacterium]|nr:glycoside hydrolase family 5 protein [Polyangiaceae bacterium]